ncbi:perlucin-like protein [Patiria miniata]|uniref:C-type lectin domain-containing protein n=1 Tax=Patiria miniata TaxID=46514 RepID=A0A914AQB3_PATMI|nr:perlucin-like protein [Patiria miniata]
MGRTLLVFAFLVVVIGMVCAVQQCGDGYTRRGYYGNCYKVSLHRDLWIQARERCRLEGGWLVTIRNGVDQNWVTDFYQRHSPRPCSDGYWIGANDIGNEKSWVWDENGDPVTYTNWQPEEPNNHNGREDAAEVRMSDSKWNDMDHLTGDERCYICEKPPSSC